MIQAIPVKLPAFVITWDGTHADAKAIAAMLTGSIGDQLLNLHYRAETNRANELTIHIDSRNGEWIRYLHAYDSLSLVVDPRDDQVLAVMEHAMERDTIVLQEGAPRAIGQ